MGKVAPRGNFPELNNPSGDWLGAGRGPAAAERGPRGSFAEQAHPVNPLLHVGETLGDYFGERFLPSPLSSYIC